MDKHGVDDWQPHDLVYEMWPFSHVEHVPGRLNDAHSPKPLWRIDQPGEEAAAKLRASNAESDPRPARIDHREVRRVGQVWHTRTAAAGVALGPPMLPIMSAPPG